MGSSRKNRKNGDAPPVLRVTKDKARYDQASIFIGPLLPERNGDIAFLRLAEI
jgi:hypothetical protein